MFCQCGCGQRTAVAPQTDKRRGWIQGQPQRFVWGHNSLPKTPDYVVDSESGCWVWQKQRYTTGYGKKWFTGQRRYGPAHRWYYESVKGGIVVGLELDHLCRNRQCVNPDHLEPVSRTENARRGAKTKLTLEQARTIVARHRAGEPLALLACEFPVSAKRVRDIAAGRAWPEAQGA